MERHKPDVYAAFAVILPVSLGLGLIYLATTGAIEPLAAILSIVAIAVIIPVAAALAPMIHDEESQYYFDRPKR